jgi:hypothetical protein
LISNRGSLSPTPTILSSYPISNELDVLTNSNVKIVFDREVKIDCSKINLREYDTGKIVETIKTTFGLNGFFVSGITLDPMKELDSVKKYYIEIEPTAIESWYVPAQFYQGTTNKDSWCFTTKYNLNFIDYIYPAMDEYKNGDTSLPPMPEGSNEDYSNELLEIAKSYGYEKQLAEIDLSSILNETIPIPIFDGTYIYKNNDSNITVKQALNDIIFLSQLQEYIKKLDLEISEAQDTSNFSFIEKYDEYMSYYYRYAQYIQGYRDGSADYKSAFTTLMTLFALNTLIDSTYDAADGDYSYILRKMIPIDLSKENIENNSVADFYMELALQDGYIKDDIYNNCLEIINGSNKLYNGVIDPLYQHLLLDDPLDTEKIVNYGIDTFSDIIEDSNSPSWIKNFVKTSYISYDFLRLGEKSLGSVAFTLNMSSFYFESILSLKNHLIDENEDSQIEMEICLV